MNAGYQSFGESQMDAASKLTITFLVVKGIPLREEIVFTQKTKNLSTSSSFYRNLLFSLDIQQSRVSPDETLSDLQPLSCHFTNCLTP